MPPLSLLQAYGSRQKNAFINHCCFGCLSQKRRFLWRLPYPVFVLLSDQFDHSKLIFLGSPSAHSLKKNQGKQDKVGPSSTRGWKRSSIPTEKNNKIMDIHSHIYRPKHHSQKVKNVPNILKYKIRHFFSQMRGRGVADFSRLFLLESIPIS